MRGVRERSLVGKDRRWDFRLKLVSVFMDNLNPIVDQKGLWGIFKSFGLVRDLYLSPKSRMRRSCFAFVRFSTMVEAEMLAKLTNGIHVYGWPIISKIADREWSKRDRYDFRGLCRLE